MKRTKIVRLSELTVKRPDNHTNKVNHSLDFETIGIWLAATILLTFWLIGQIIN